MKKKFRKSVFVVSYSLENNLIEYAILKRKKHWRGWEFPKGGVEKNESLIKAAKREVKEETNLDIIKIKNHKIYGKYLYKKSLTDRPGAKGQSYYLFSCQVEKNKIKVDKKEHFKGVWMNYEKALNKITHQNQKKCLSIINSWLERNNKEIKMKIKNSKFREIILESGTKIFLGKDAQTNDDLMKKYIGKENLILHTVKPGSPFCVIDESNPLKEDIKKSAIICASKSQDWRDNKKSVKLHLFNGRDIKKNSNMKIGAWALMNKPKIISIKKEEINNLIQKRT